MTQARTPAQETPATPAWHHLAATEAARVLTADAASGLSDEQVNERLQRFGEDRLAEKPPRSNWLAFLDQFKSLLILVLIGAAALAGGQ